jgi:DNA polymerase-4
VGGGRHGDGIVIAASEAKDSALQLGMACFDARKLCPQSVLFRPHYDDYRRLSHEMFHVLEDYTPTLVPISIDEGFLDFTTMDHRRAIGAASTGRCPQKSKSQVRLHRSAK